MSAKPLYLSLFNRCPKHADPSSPIAYLLVLAHAQVYRLNLTCRPDLIGSPPPHADLDPPLHSLYNTRELSAYLPWLFEVAKLYTRTFVLGGCVFIVLVSAYSTLDCVTNVRRKHPRTYNHRDENAHVRLR